MSLGCSAVTRERSTYFMQQGKLHTTLIPTVQRVWADEINTDLYRRSLWISALSDQNAAGYSASSVGIVCLTVSFISSVSICSSTNLVQNINNKGKASIPSLRAMLATSVRWPLWCHYSSTTELWLFRLQKSLVQRWPSPSLPLWLRDVIYSRSTVGLYWHNPSNMNNFLWLQSCCIVLMTPVITGCVYG